MKAGRLPALCAIAGPAAFTVAWVAGSLRQAGHSLAAVQLSGLAAEDARDPQIMVAGFVVLGACSAVFGAGLGRVTAPRAAGPRLVICAGVAAAAAGVFRRDHMLLTGPGFTGESWHNQVHDVASGVAYGAMLAAPLVLAHRLRNEPGWARPSRAVGVLGLASAVTMVVFASGVVQPWNGVVQRAAVTLALLAEAVAGVRLLTLPPPGGPPARPASAGYWPARPSMRSRSRSAWPLCRAYSSIMCTSTDRRRIASRPPGRES